DQHVKRRQRGMAAERDLRGRREPAQVERRRRLPRRQRKRRLAVLELAGDPLHRLSIEVRSVEQDAGGVARERLRAERIDAVAGPLHTPLFPPKTNLCNCNCSRAGLPLCITHCARSCGATSPYDGEKSTGTLPHSSSRSICCSAHWKSSREVTTTFTSSPGERRMNSENSVCGSFDPGVLRSTIFR